MSDELPPLPSAYKWKGPSGRVECDESATCSAAAHAVGWRAEPLFTQAAIDAAVAAERERIATLLDAIREHWAKANGADSLSVGALDQIAEVIADGSYVAATSPAPTPPAPQPPAQPPAGA